MTMTEARKPAIRINWICVQRGFFFATAFAFTFAAGGWLVSIRVDETSLAYKTRAAHKFEQVQAVAGPNPVAQIKCLTRKSDVASNKLNQAIAAAEYISEPVPSSTLPFCPPPKPEKPSASAQK